MSLFKMNLAKYLIVFAVCTSLPTGAFNFTLEKPINCIQPSLFQFALCKIPPPLSSGSNTSVPQLQKQPNLAADCTLNREYIQCMTDLLSRVCEPHSPSNQYFIQTMDKQLASYNATYEQACKTGQHFSSRRNVYVSNEIQSQSDELACNDIRQYKCESRSLYRTCGYPTANPKSNLVAFCNEMRAYLKCSKCKISLCKLKGNTAHIERQETE